MVPEAVRGNAQQPPLGGPCVTHRGPTHPCQHPWGLCMRECAPDTVERGERRCCSACVGRLSGTPKKGPGAGTSKTEQSTAQQSRTSKHCRCGLMFCPLCPLARAPALRNRHWYVLTTPGSREPLFTPACACLPPFHCPHTSACFRPPPAQLCATHLQQLRVRPRVPRTGEVQHHAWHCGGPRHLQPL